MDVEKHFIKESIHSDILAALVREYTGKSSQPIISEIHTGFFNNVYHIQNKEKGFILKVAPNEAKFILPNEIKLLQREAALTDVLAGHSHLFPRLLYQDFSRKIINRDYLIEEMMPGTIWDTMIDELKAEENASLYKQLGLLNKNINAIEGSYFGFPNPSKSYTTWSEAIFTNISAMANMTEELNIDINGLGQFKDLLLNHFDKLNEVTSAKLVHGDLWPKNILIQKHNGKYGISGVIDCERGYYGDPMAEWIIHFLDIPIEYWDGYGIKPAGSSAYTRNLIYKGMYCIQLYLEMARERKSDAWIAEIFNAVIEDLKCVEAN